MNRTVGARYLPLAAIVAIQLLIVAVAPSRMANDQQVSSGGGVVQDDFAAGVGGDFTDPGTGEPVSDDGGVTGVPVDTGTTDGGTPDGGTTDGGGGDATTPGGGGSGDATTPGGGGGDDGTTGTNAPQTVQGDKSHCKGDRQFDPGIDFYAPPCVAKSNGQNPGATYQGVSAKEIKIVQYDAKGNDAVDAILKAQGAFVSFEQYKAYNAAAVNFINQNYELYGRKVVIKTVQGTCETIPPDVSCLQGEMRKVVQQEKPFALFWDTSLCSACFAELSKLRTVNLGGWNFRDEFGQRWRPYHYDVTMSGTRLAQHAGRFWCQQLTGHNAEYSRNYKDKTRQLGVIATNDPENQNTVEIDLKRELAKCGQDYGNRKYFYEQDISTADQQRRAGVLAMRGDAVNPNDDATSVMCFCDLVAPAFLYQEEDTQQYYPENIVTGTGFMDTDASAQAYIGAVGCPQGNPCAFDGAFGFRSISKLDPQFKTAGHRVYAAGGGKGQTFEAAWRQWDYLNLIMSSIQMAGPNLNPETFEQGAFRLGARGDANHVLRQISPGNYYWGQDVMRTYWSSTKTSSYNGKRGTYVHLDQKRTPVDGWTKQKLSLPAAPR
jgi:hypothetical protein